ncbi:hypothetical protein [Kitasatospora sp. NBC_01302]|uniref:hypothetical protein n=1 Tax=Kitasatospora sp. NBC_01302 TaxID=2903575 RepID=UPI002E13D979|nr:hypothetical protein OG294_14260 [Kitasatospora sp. NBC_01302]
MSSNDIYNDAAFDITSVPSWKTPPLHGAYAPNAKLSPRAKAGIAAGGVILAATGMVAYSDYASSQATAHVKAAQIALQQAQLDLQRQQQEAAQAAAAGQETQAEQARRQAVQDCVAKASGDSMNAVSQCSAAFPAITSPGMSTTSDTVSGGKSSAAGSDVGLIVLGSVGAVTAVGWAKKRFGHRASSL